VKFHTWPHYQRTNKGASVCLVSRKMMFHISSEYGNFFLLKCKEMNRVSGFRCRRIISRMRRSCCFVTRVGMLRDWVTGWYLQVLPPLSDNIVRTSLGQIVHCHSDLICPYPERGRIEKWGIQGSWFSDGWAHYCFIHFCYFPWFIWMRLIFKI
jgi:hypothetical protein